jgi:hypothetical protein
VAHAVGEQGLNGRPRNRARLRAGDVTASAIIAAGARMRDAQPESKATMTRKTGDQAARDGP